jgi:hypothetical protein
MILFRGGSIAWALATDASGLVLVGKLMGGSVDFGGGPLTGDGPGFVLALDPAGKHRFSRRFGADGDLDDNLTAVALDRTGSAVVVGAASHARDGGFTHTLFAAKLFP